MLKDITTIKLQDTNIASPTTLSIFNLTDEKNQGKLEDLDVF